MPFFSEAKLIFIFAPRRMKSFEFEFLNFVKGDTLLSPYGGLEKSFDFKEWCFPQQLSHCLLELPKCPLPLSGNNQWSSTGRTADTYSNLLVAFFFPYSCKKDSWYKCTLYTVQGKVGRLGLMIGQLTS